MHLRKVLSALFLFTGILKCTDALADVKLPSVFSDHMVLQRDSIVPIWGWAAPGEVVTVVIAEQTKTTAG